MQFLWGLGVREDEVGCYDVYGFDEELLEMVPKPVLAVLFLYPLTSQVCCLGYTNHFPCSILYASTILKKNSYYDFLLQSEEERIQQDSTTKVSLINPLSGYLQDSKDTSHEFL